MRVIHVPVTVALSAALVATAACHKSEGPAGPADKPTAPAAAQAPLPEGTVRLGEASLPFITVDQVSGAAADGVVEAPAHVEFRDDAVSQVGAPLDGRVVTVHVVLGQRVKAGDPLVTLECPEALTLRSASPVAAAALREARIELERQHRMLKEGVGVERDVVTAETRVATTEAEAARVAQTLTAVGPGTGATVVVHAPLGGVVTARKATPGLTVQHGTDPLVEIGNASALWLVADVFERDLPRLHAGAKTRVALATAGEVLTGHVASVGAVVSTELRTAPVYIAIAARGATLRPGQYGRASIAGTASGLSLPVSAVLVKDGKDSIVYVESGPGTFVRRSVVVSAPADGRVQVLSGLTAGERVVVKGALLIDGASDQLL